MTSNDVDALVVLTRLELYNRDVACGARAVRRHLHQQTGLTSPLPSTGSSPSSHATA